MEIDIEKEYPSKFDSSMSFDVKYSIEKNGYISCHIPMINSFYSAKNMEEAKKKASAMVMCSIRFWEEENEKGTFKGVFK